jgi:diacylglycerol kinase (ATP)
MKKSHNPFKAAGKGFLWFYQTQWNAKVHLLATAAAIALGWFLGIAKFEWLLIMLVIGMVWAAELLNTSIEFLLNRLHPEWDAAIGKAKDVSAAAVLAASIIALLCGLIIFIPYILVWIKMA